MIILDPASTAECPYLGAGGVPDILGFYKVTVILHATCYYQGQVQKYRSNKHIPSLCLHNSGPVVSL